MSANCHCSATCLGKGAQQGSQGRCIPGGYERTAQLATLRHGVDFPHPAASSASPLYQAQAGSLLSPITPLSPIIAMPTGGGAAFLPFALPPPLPVAILPPPFRSADDFKLEIGVDVHRVSTVLDDKRQAPLSLSESLFGGDELGLQYTQSLAEQLAQMCMTD